MGQAIAPALKNFVGIDGRRFYFSECKGITRNLLIVRCSLKTLRSFIKLGGPDETSG
jgi:hypothetical protein